MKRSLGILAILLVSASALWADGKTDPGYDAAYTAALKGKRVKLAIGSDTVSTCPLRCGSIDGYEDGVVEVYPKADGSVGWSAVKKPEVTPSIPVFPSCPTGTCPNQRYYR